MNPERLPNPPAAPWPTVNNLTRSVAATAALLARGRVHLPRPNVGRRLPFTDGSEAVVYRETLVDRGPTRRPAVLLVSFRRVLALVCEPGSIRYRVLPDIRRDDFLANPVLATDAGAPAPRTAAEAWWLPAQPVLAVRRAARGTGWGAGRGAGGGSGR